MLDYDHQVTVNRSHGGYRGTWYFNQPSGDEYVYKYSGGLGTYCAKHRPFAIYRPEVDKTFFCYGGADADAHTRHSAVELADGHRFEAPKPGCNVHMVSAFDHATGTVPRPTMVLDKLTTDAHDNPVLAMDGAGYLWVFSTSHGRGRPSYLHRSSEPYAIDTFVQVEPTRADGGQQVPLHNFSYMQPWHVPGAGFFAFFTHYHDPVARTICFMRSEDGQRWSEWTRLAAIGDGHYQISEVWRSPAGVRAGTAFNYHPDGPNSRTNLYYLQSDDGGAAWTTAGGSALSVPLSTAASPAMVHETASAGLHVYLKDIAFTAAGHPVILYLVSPGYESGPRNGPRTWTTARWTGNQWTIRPAMTSDSNYDTGALYLEGDTWRIVAPTDQGPQPFNPGGEMVMWESADQGASWQRVRTLTAGSPRNHTYARRPVNANDGFYAYWADGNPRQPSVSQLYFCDRDGTVFTLPFDMPEGEARPAGQNSQS